MSTENPAASEHAALKTVPEKLPRESHPHAPKFKVAFGALIGIAFAAIVVAVAVVIAHGNNKTTTTASVKNWSAWSPTSSGSAGITEIADYVAPYYRATTSAQLDAITPISVSQSTSAGTTTGSGMTVVVNTASSTAKAESLELLTGKTIAYNVCGLGAKDCELAGTATINRMLLLRRESLELALYTFKYTDASNVVVVLPPGHTESATGTAGSAVDVSVLFVRSELNSFLHEKLSKTLSDYPLDVAELGIWAKTTEAEEVDEVTADSLFSSKIEAQQEGGNLLVMSALPSQ